ncbi:MAG: hypothetical protein ACOC80_11065 [Petrotogales bacterium]
MPWKVGNKTTKGWQILKKENGRWKVVGYSNTKKNASESVRARYAAKSTETTA